MIRTRDLDELLKRFARCKDPTVFQVFYAEASSLVFFIAYKHLEDKEAALRVTSEVFMFIFDNPDAKQGLDANTWINQLVQKFCK